MQVAERPPGTPHRRKTHGGSAPEDLRGDPFVEDVELNVTQAAFARSGLVSGLDETNNLWRFQLAALYYALQDIARLLYHKNCGFIG